MATNKREYKCKYDCGFTRSRKAKVIEHEKTCNHRIVDRLKEECKELRDVNNETNKIIEELKTQLNGFQNQINALQNQVNGLMRRRKREEKDDAIHNFKWKKDLRFDREFHEGVMKKTTELSLAMDTFVMEFLKRTPVFYKVKKQTDKLEVKGVLGIMNRQPVGVDNVITTQRFSAFYDVIMDMLLDELFDHHNNIAIENDEALPPKERETDEAREERIMKTFNLDHYRPKPNNKKHNKTYRVCRNRIISLMHSTMTEKQTQKVLIL